MTAAPTPPDVNCSSSSTSYSFSLSLILIMCGELLPYGVVVPYGVALATGIVSGSFSCYMKDGRSYSASTSLSVWFNITGVLLSFSKESWGIEDELKLFLGNKLLLSCYYSFRLFLPSRLGSLACPANN